MLGHTYCRKFIFFDICRYFDQLTLLYKIKNAKGQNSTRAILYNNDYNICTRFENIYCILHQAGKAY